MKNTLRIIRNGLEKRRFEIRLAAPAFFFLTVLLRCYLESAVFAVRPYFSYFVAWHHVLWYFTVILFIILVTHLILKVAVERLLWLMYGAVLTLIPVIVVMIQGKPLAADYLTGSCREIISHIATIYFTYRQNWPLTLEVVIIFVGMTVVGYHYSRSLLRGLFLGLTVYLGGNLLAVSWIGSYPYERVVFKVHSALLNHAFMAAVCAHSATFFAFLAAWRAGLMAGSFRYWVASAVTAMAAGFLYMAVVAKTGWFSNPVDIGLTALPVWTTTFLAAVRGFRKKLLPNRWFWVIGLTVLGFQWAVMGPIYFHMGVIRPLTTREFWMLPLRPF